MRFFQQILVLIFLSASLFAYSVKLTPFLEEQMHLQEQMNEQNATQEKIEHLMKIQNQSYHAALDKVMINKNYFINNTEQYESEIFSLQKVMKINARAGNRYAVIRDEALLNSYLLLRAQNRLIRDVLLELDQPTIDAFEIELNKLAIKNQTFVATLYKPEYDEILALQSGSYVVKAAQNNITELKLLKDVNADFIGYLYKFQSKLYRLDKYSKYHLITLAVYVDSIEFVKIINPLLEGYGLSVIKLLSIFILSLFIYFFRKIIYVSLENYVLKIGFLQEYASQILKEIRSSIESMIIIININMAIYVYNDFSSIEIISRAFNMIYVLYITLIIYKSVNTVSAIKLTKFTKDGSVIKNDLINVGIKILNFTIVMIGLLVMLFFAGVNLTAVLSGLGIGGFAVAFAAKDTISNFFGTLSILFSDVFSQGDWIEIDGHEGVVVEIGLRVTTIRTFDNALIAIPNGTFASKDVKNWDKRILGRRIKMHVGVKYDSKSEDIKQAVEEIREMLDKHPGIATKATKYTHFNAKHHTAKLVSKDDLEGVKNTLLVYLDDFGDSSINILIYCFTKSVRWVDWLETKEDVMHQIMSILEKNNLEFAFPSLSIYNEK